MKTRIYKRDDLFSSLFSFAIQNNRPTLNGHLVLKAI